MPRRHGDLALGWGCADLTEVQKFRQRLNDTMTSISLAIKEC